MTCHVEGESDSTDTSDGESYSSDDSTDTETTSIQDLKTILEAQQTSPKSDVLGRKKLRKSLNNQGIKSPLFSKRTLYLLLLIEKQILVFCH